MRLIWLQLLAAGVALYLANGCATAAKASTSRGVAQYKLPLPAPLPDHESVAVSGADQARRTPQQQQKEHPTSEGALRSCGGAGLLYNNYFIHLNHNDNHIDNNYNDDNNK